MKLELSRIKKHTSFEEINLDLNLEKCVFFHGNEELDNRCKASTSYFTQRITNSFQVIYNEENFDFSVTNKSGSNKFKIHTLGKSFIDQLDEKNFILDSTSLGFAEILILLHFLSDKEDLLIKIFYVEPNEYKLKSKKNVFKHEFDLSEGFNSFRKIPPYSLLIDSSSSEKAKLITLLGFENERLSRILEDDDGARYDDFNHIIALPAFNPGWENISLQRHSQELKGFKDLEFAPANNPYETYKVLENIQKNSNNKSLVIAPIGTKPHSIGAIIFLINSKLNNKKVGLIYDFPIKKENRTEGIGIIHEYTLNMISNTD